MQTPEPRQLTSLQHTDPAPAVNYRLPDFRTSPCLWATHRLFLCQEHPTPNITSLGAASTSRFHVLLLTPRHVTPHPLTPLSRAFLHSPGILRLTLLGHLWAIFISCLWAPKCFELLEGRQRGWILIICAFPAHSVVLGACCTEWGTASLCFGRSWRQVEDIILEGKGKKLSIP